MSATEIQGFELSPQQRVHWQFSGGATPRATTVIAAVPWELPVDSLTAAITAAAGRHEILRTTYRQIPGLRYPLQLIRDSLPPDVSLTETRDTPFDPDHGPVFRLAFRESSRRHQLSLSAPSIGCDAESLRVVLDEALAILRGECPAANPIQYADYAAWVGEMAAAPEAAAGVEFWARISASPHFGAELLLRQTPNRQRPETVGIAPLPARLWSAVSDVPSDAERQLAAAWFHLIGRHCDREALIGGYVFRGRSLPDLTRAVGAYARCLPVEIEISHPRKWQQLMEQIDQRLAQAESWQDCYKPPESPLAMPASFECTQALETSAADVLAQTASGDRAELHLHVRLEGHARSGGITFDRRCYSDGAAAELADQLAESLAPASKPAVWKGATLPGPADASILDRITEHARLGPDHAAIRSASDVLTYRELDRRSDCLAAHLRSIGTGPGSLVPIYFDRGPWFVVAALGVMKAGAAYVPLDPDYPADRNAFFIRESRCSLILTQSAVAASLPASDRRTLMVDALNETPAPAQRPRIPEYEPGLRHFHVGLDRRSQGRGGVPSQPALVHIGPQRGVPRKGREHAAAVGPSLRQLCGRNLLDAIGRRHASHRQPRCASRPSQDCLDHRRREDHPYSVAALLVPPRVGGRRVAEVASGGHCRRRGLPGFSHSTPSPAHSGYLIGQRVRADQIDGVDDGACLRTRRRETRFHWPVSAARRRGHPRS